MIDGKERASESSELNTEQQEHLLSKIPPFEEHIKQLEASSTRSSVSSNSLPKTPAVESVLYGDGSEVHMKPTDLSLKSQERPPILMTDEDFLPEPEQSANSKGGIFRLEEASGTSQAESETNKEQTEGFYADLDIPEDEPHFSEAVEIKKIIDWQTFPSEIKTEPIDDTDKTGQEAKRALTQIQSFAEYAKENPPDEFDSRNIGADDRLILGDKYNGLVLDYRKAAEHRARIGSPELPPALTKKFCHELASIIHEYKEDEEIWRLIGERSLEDAFGAYADIKGIDAVVEDFGEEIPEQIDRYTIFPLISKINDAVRQDWQRRITPAGSYEQGQSYSFLCSRVKEPFSAQESRNNIFSCSLLTDSHHETIGDNGSFGFIFPPDHIIAAAPHDIYTHNWSDDDESSLRSGVPVVMSYDRVLRESQEDKTYSEITTRDLPTGIFYLKDKIDEEGRKKLAELIRINPGLPIIAL